ncbi:PREDICTED: uncharacterized protein LOC106746246 isoform X2 [Dinoponera quadriceps]|uniref:limulus clotting factor C n=1 Tax=Dinoponera quadriceps TaxID=609295 RepID=A0A6P3XIS1_DINQU|nr:PREDICTED: uncharacterized protein LOC106746246 isoform X2 [Dinoponera quadriceps]
MTASFNRFLVALCVVHICVVFAIYDPRATTTKPPERREAVPPWYSAGKANESGIQATPFAPKWQTHDDDVSSKPATKGWGPWRKNPGNEIEQRTQVNTQDHPAEQVPEQQHHPEFNKWEEQGNLKSSPPREGSVDSDKNRGGFQDASKYGSRGSPQNMIDFENKLPPRYDDTSAGDENLYEGVPVDSTKPHKENILISWKPRHTVARYSRQFGVQCPDHNSTGQFVYPLDCKFFVNCWKGRAFVQPCAPGTYFNPNTLECDFPHKVKCYEGEFADYREPIYSESQVDRNSQKLQEPKCPPYVTGLMPHYGDCTKFLQCANGATYVMDCGPGTVFNPALSVCDWPRNVKGCEDTFKSEEDVKILLTPPSPQTYPYAHDKLKYTDGKKIACPADFTGLLPHPETCKKFLQCANGATFVMDCGPGTAFNPLTTVCDWPYNVPGCNTDKPGDEAHRTTGNSWPPSGEVGSGTATWSDTNRYNGTGDSHGAGSWPGYRATTTTTLRPPWAPITPGPVLYPTWKPSSVTTTSRVLYPTMRPSFVTTPAPRWIPTWTTARPSYDRPGHAADHRGHYGRVYEDGQYRDHGPYRPEWRPSGGDFGRPKVDGDYGYYDRYDEQWAKDPDAGHPPGTRHFDRRPSGQPWPPERRFPPDHGYDHGYHPRPPYSPNLPHGYGPAPGPPANPSWDSDSSAAVPADGDYGREYYGGYAPHTGDGRWRPDGHQHRPPYHRHHHHHDHRHHFGDAVSPGETDRGRLSPYFPDGRHEEDDTQYREDAQTTFPGAGNPPANRRTGYDFSQTSPRQDGPSPGLHRPDFNRTSPPTGNVFLNSGDQFAESSNQTRYGPWRDGPPAPRPEQGNTAWSRADGSAFQPSTWRDQPSRGHADTPTRPLDQDAQENKFHQWQSGSDIYQQSTVDRENDAKMAQWASKTNIFAHSRGQIGPDSPNETKHPKTNLYPDGIYANVNGVKGHFITKEIESNQTRPEMQYPYEVQKPFDRDNNLNSTDYGYAPLFNVTTSTGTTATRPPNKPSVPTRRAKDLTNTTNTIREKEPRVSRDESRSHLPGVSIEQVDLSSGIDTKLSDISSEFPDILARETGDYVDVLDEKNEWKPKLVFKNKTEDITTAPSVVMRITPKKTDVELFNIEAPPFKEEEPPFPVYYVPLVRPLTHSQKTALLTPISGQVIRLRGGTGPNDGYVEVQGALPGWGIVCDSRNSWTLKEAHIVCRQLGYTRGAEMAWQGRNNHNGVPTWVAANTVTCLGNETRFQSCKFTHNQECRVDRDAVGVRCLSNHIAHCRKDEIPHEEQCYHLAEPVGGLNRAEASDYCKRRNARLIDIANQAENNFVSEWLLQLYPEVSSIMTSGTGFAIMNRPFWLWEDSTHAMFKFTKWWPGWVNDTEQPPQPLGPRPLCIVMKRKFPCHELAESTCVADYFFWDTEDCADSSKLHSFVCERPYEDIGCVYGKGNQYAGKANVTLSGNECLPWADQRIAHQLRVNVVSEEAREKLRTHNFCRNPNPAKESRPWCFAGPTGEREYCDIPACRNIDPKRSTLTGQHKPRHFECMPGEYIPSPWVCDGEEDCTNGADERKCAVDLSLFEKSAKHKLDGYDVEKWLNTPLKTCALRCKEADFTCRSFNHKAEGNICLLSDSNIGSTGALKSDRQFDYYEMTERSVNCDGMYICNNRKCINQSQVCNGKNDCNDRSDESICTAENLDYEIRLAGTNSSHEGRVEVKVLGHWGQVCDDGFGMINADVICRELGFVLGALDVRQGGFYGNLDPPTKFMVDQLKCRGNETTLRECDFNGWGVHNCQPEEAVGIVCKTAVNTCQQDYWKCDNSAACISTSFICDEVVDCPDGSDESPEHCDAPFELRLVDGDGLLQGRVEVRHYGVWGTVCDDDFTHNAAAVICRSLGYGGRAIAKKNGFFGPGEGPIWLDEVFCHGNETQLHRCDHNHWGRHNCNHNEDAGVICSPGDVSERKWTMVPELPERSIDEILPAKCGQRAKDFNDDEDLIFAKVVHGSIAPKGTYPWQASVRVRGHSRSNHWCGAVIVSPLHVLTAAHCLEGYNKGTYFVRAGDYNTDIEEGTEVEANIEDYYVHEEFRIGHKMNNDIALVLLKGPGIPLGKDIMPICLPPENTEYPAGLNCTISGFGSIETGKTTQSKDLRYGWVPLLDQSICRAGYVYGEGAISDGMICAGYLDEGIDTCDGDSGGPLACYHNGAFTLYGITSWGQHCGRANKPGVYVRVAYYRRWIDQKIKESLAGR